MLSLCPGATAAQADGKAHHARAHHQQATDPDEDEPRQIHAQESCRILALAERANRLVTAIGAMVHSVADQVWMDAKGRQVATKVLAGVL